MQNTEDSSDDRKKSNEEDNSKSTSESNSEVKTESSKETDIKTKENENNKSSEFSSLVANHYNTGEGSFEVRNRSRIYYLRNFNNWIKSMLIREAVLEAQGSNFGNIIALDLCCGRGGDLFKWLKLNIKYLVCADIAELSLQQYKTKYSDYLQKCEKNKTYCSLKCEFIAADCTRVRLRQKYSDPSIQFDVVSCQFSFHYAFESLPQAECMLKNVSECLRPGGFFIGTIPNTYEIVKRLKQLKSTSCKNDIFHLEMCSPEPYPLFGAKYHFYLEGVVNCPEFLVHFPTFERLARKFGLKLERREKFVDYYERMKKTRAGEFLMKKIIALEAYERSEKGGKLVGEPKDYIHAKKFCEEKNVEEVRTLSQSEWDVVSLYQTFVFKKCGPSDPNHLPAKKENGSNS